MKKFILKICLFLGLCIIMDYVAGFTFDYLKKHAKGGSTHNNYYILNDCNVDIVILGSSRAKHHYCPSIIEDSLGLSCYNCSEEGNGVMLANARYHAIVNRYTPKVVVYEITPSFDYQVVEDNTKFLRYLKPYYRQPEVKDVVDKFVDPTTRLTLMSQMYQNNSSLLAYILDNVSARGSQQGFIPLTGTMKKEPDLESNENFKVDDDKLFLLEDIVRDCNSRGITLVFTMSPFYKINDTSDYNIALELAQKYEINVLDYLQDSNFKDISLYQDNNHLNNAGAIQYSKVFAHDLKEIIE